MTGDLLKDPGSAGREWSVRRSLNDVDSNRDANFKIQSCNAGSRMGSRGPC